MSRRIEERHSRVLTGLLKLPENKKCFDCPSKVNVYANLFNSTFICEKCSGLHRELNHRVKSISASTFTPEEVSGLQKGGNGVAKSIWLATWSWREYPEPDAHEVDEVRQFMRAKYVKKQWYRDPNGGNSGANDPVHAPAEPIIGSPSPSTSSSNGGVLVVPDRVRAISKSQSVDSLNMTSSVSSAGPERTLSRKSSTVSSDSGSTTFSKSTNLSSAVSSPFNAGGSKNVQPLAQQQQQHSQQQYQQQYQQQHQQHQQQQQQQQQQQEQFRQLQQSGSFDNFASLMTAGSSTPGNSNPQNYSHSNASMFGSSSQTFVATPAAIDSAADPFSLMTNAFNNMGMSSPQSQVPSSSISDSFAHSYGHTPLSQTSMPSSDDFFAAFSTGPATQSSSVNHTIESNDPFSLTRPHTSSQGLSFSVSAGTRQDPSPSIAAAEGTAISGARSFDDYLSILGNGQQSQHIQQASSPSNLSSGNIFGSPASMSSPNPAFSSTFASSSLSSLSPQSTGGSNPFGKQQEPQLQRAHAADYPQASTGTSIQGGQSNPFSMFAKQNQHQPTTPNQHQHLQNHPALMDPFSRQQQQQQQQQQNQDHFSTPGLESMRAASPNPFMMSARAQATVQSPFEQHQPMPPAFMRSVSESSHNFQNAFGSSTNYSGSNSSGYSQPHGSNTAFSSNNFESAFSLPGTPTRSMTVPASSLSHGNIAPMHNTGNGNGSGSTNDMFGQWMRPSPMAATSKYPSIDDLDPFSTSSVTPSVVASTYSNPFSLNM